MRHDVRSVLPVQATLGEGPVWIGRDAALWFVDIKQRHVPTFRREEIQLLPESPARGITHFRNTSKRAIENERAALALRRRSADTE